MQDGNEVIKNEAFWRGYKSHIKVSGISLLPPLITPERRIELQQDKQKAIEIERRLDFEKNLKLFALQYREKDLSPYDFNLCDKILDDLSDTDVSHINALNILSPSLGNQTLYNVPLLDEPVNILSASIVELDLTVSPKPKPPLIRSQTFILTQPSTFLLKHTERPQTCPSAIETTNEKSDCCNVDQRLSDSLLEMDCSYKSVIDSVQNSETLPCGDDFDMPETCYNPFDNAMLPNSDSDILKSVSGIELLDLSVDNQNVFQMASNDCQKDISLTSQLYLINNCDNSKLDNFIEGISTPNSSDFERENCDNEIDIIFKQDIKTPSLVSSFGFSLLDCPNFEVPDDEIISTRSSKEQRRLKEQWAGRVLTAAAKGYLVRRLKRTERVQNLIQTIKEALVCALSLHTEFSKDIQTSDVELHRRLIQQVTAACYDFYNIFFTLSTKEKMDLIAVDRQRLLDKVNKTPKIGSLRRLNSSKSSGKLQKRNFGKKQ